jgi:hypothetical protein
MTKDWDEATANYFDARRAAGTPAGIEYANRLAAMPPDEAAAEISRMFALCASEDLAGDIAGDLQLPDEVAKAIADAIIRQRGDDPDRAATIKTIMELLARVPFEERTEVLQSIVDRQERMAWAAGRTACGKA